MQSLLLLILFLLLCTSTTSYYENCSYLDRSREAKPPIYWINLERSRERGVKMQATVELSKFEGIRVSGVDATRGEIYLPPDIEKTWPGAWCIKDLPIMDENNPPNGTKVVMTGLCGRARKVRTFMSLFPYSTIIHAVYSFPSFLLYVQSNFCSIVGSERQYNRRAGVYCLTFTGDQEGRR